MTSPPGATLVYYAVVLSEPGPNGNRSKIGPEHQAGTFGEARRHLDWLNSYGLVFRWTPGDGKQLAAKRDDNGQWWRLTQPDEDGWQVLPPGEVPEPAAAAAEPATAPPTPVDVATAAASNGHLVTADPAPLSVNQRWTCVCGAVVLRQPGGQLFGTALTERCTAGDHRGQSPSTAS